MKTSISNREIWRIAIPIMLGNFAQTVITFTDTAFLGHLGVVALGASMIAGLYYFVFTTLAMGFSIGIQIIIARRFGEGNNKQIGVVFQHGAVFVFFLGILMFLILRIFTSQLLSMIIDSHNIYASSMEYIKYRQFGIIFVCFNFLYRSLYVGLSNTKIITFSTLIMAVVNIFLDYCLIFGNFGFPEMGIGGAALASFAAEVSATLFFTIYTYLSSNRIKYGLFKIRKLEKDLMHNIMKIATPTMIQRMFSFGAWFVFFVLIEKMGEVAIGVSSIVRSAYMIIITPVFGFCATANTLTSRIIGEGKIKEVLPTVNKVLINGLLCCLPLCILCSIIPSAIISIYTDDMTLAAAAVPSIIVVCIATFTQAFGNIYFDAVSGTGNTNAALYLEFGILVIYIFYVWMMSHLTPHIHWVWTAELVYGFLIGLVSLIYIKYAHWQKKLI